MEIAAAVAEKLLQINAIKLSPQKPFIWASGRKSPIYCDNRVILSYPEVRRFITNAFVEKSKSFAPFDTIAGVATAGIAHGVLLASALDLPFVYVRSSAKAHGRQNQIEGELPSKSRVLVIEDLISTGGSSLAAVEALREAGAQIAGVLAIFTYGFPEALAAFETSNCHLDTLCDYPSLLHEAINSNYIEADNLATLEIWSKDPVGWSERLTATK
ncbi:MAG TPA: orotate phosphoribosyltransferase [Saprospiraceae bacterium]|nr:orotate phosphoribosyltransferase [Saprospiraceae bacterium]HMQ81279.1 orotate phosphoribosyltransferase [Saprospiraceae bacterium]